MLALENIAKILTTGPRLHLWKHTHLFEHMHLLDHIRYIKTTVNQIQSILLHVTSEKYISMQFSKTRYGSHDNI